MDAPGLEFKKDNIGYSEVSFLDFGIKIEPKKNNIQLYCEKDDFPFPIPVMLLHSSSIPSDMFYFAFRAEILRTACTTSKC